MSLAKNVEKKAEISVDPSITSDWINFDDLSLVLSTHLDQALFLTPATENSSQKLKLSEAPSQIWITQEKTLFLSKKSCGSPKNAISETYIFKKKWRYFRDMS